MRYLLHFEATNEAGGRIDRSAGGAVRRSAGFWTC